LKVAPDQVSWRWYQ